MPVRLAPGPSQHSSDETHSVEGCVASETMEKSSFYKNESPSLHFLTYLAMTFPNVLGQRWWKSRGYSVVCDTFE